MKSHCLVLGFVAIVAYVSAQDFNRAKRMSLAVVDTNDSKDEFHQKLEEAKQSAQGELDTEQATLVSQFFDCIGKSNSQGMVACNEEVLRPLSEDQQAKYYDALTKIAPPAVDDPNVDDDDVEDDEDEE